MHAATRKDQVPLPVYLWQMMTPVFSDAVTSDSQDCRAEGNGIVPDCCTVMSTVPKSCMAGAGPSRHVVKEPISSDVTTVGATEVKSGGEKSVPVAKHTKRVHWEDEKEKDEEETQEKNVRNKV